METQPRVTLVAFTVWMHAAVFICAVFDWAKSSPVQSSPVRQSSPV